jgi:ABC-type transporter Mla maintaining outer membrane lipid asymmetry ATPase subunit MlaF
MKLAAVGLADCGKLYQGSFLAVGTKEEIRASQDPHIRQFLDRVPDMVEPAHVVESFFEKYLGSPEVRR